jgi:hypothetical protein
MTKDEMVLAVQEMIGDTNSVYATSSTVLRYLNWAQKQIAEKTECLQKKVTITSLDADGGALLPVDFFRPIVVKWAGQNLYEVFQDQIRISGMVDAPQSNTQAVGYCVFPYFQTSATVRNPRMEFYPQQTGSQTGLNIEVWYTAYPTDLSGGTDVSGLPEFMHEIAVMYAVRKFKLQEDDYQAARELQTEIDRMMSEAMFLVHAGSYTSFSSVRDPEAGARIFWDW